MIGSTKGQDSDRAGDRAERGAFRVALVIALVPIPIALLVAWALGDPPWRARPSRVEGAVAPAEPGVPRDEAGHGHR